MSEVASFELPQAQRKRIAALVNGPDGGGPLAVRTDQGEVELPPTARAAVRRLLADLAAGTAVHLLTDDTELTTQDAADFLGISRTYVVHLVDNGKLPAHLVPRPATLEGRVHHFDPRVAQNWLPLTRRSGARRNTRSRHHQ